MTEQAADKLSKLMALLQRQPNDPFLLYGVGVEYKNRGDTAKSLEFLQKVVAADPNYCYAYFQQGQVHEQRGDVAAARSAYDAGIEAAVRSGDAHARSELEGARSMLD